MELLYCDYEPGKWKFKECISNITYKGKPPMRLLKMILNRME